MELIPQSAAATGNWCDDIQSTPSTPQHNLITLTLVIIIISLYPPLLPHQDPFTKVQCPIRIPHCLQYCWVALSPLCIVLSIVSWYRVPLHPQLTTAHLKIYSHSEEFDTADHRLQFQGIFSGSHCLVVYCQRLRMLAVAIFTLLKLAVRWSPHLSPH